MTRALAASIALVALLLAAPAVALGQDGYDTEPTREQWVRQADGICKDSGKKTNRLYHAFARSARRGKVVRAGRRLIRFGRHLLDVVAEVRDVPPPPADADAITRWLDLAARSNRILTRSGRAFTQREIRRGNRLYRRAIKAGVRSARPVKGFGLKHCV